MAKFRFKLQKVLDARISFERQAQRELGNALRQLAENEAELASLIRNAEDFKKEMAERRQRGSTVMQFRDDINRDWNNRRNISDQRYRVKKAGEEVEKRRIRLIKMMKDRKIMEKLRENQLLEFKKQQQREELKFADDIAGINAAKAE